MLRLLVTTKKLLDTAVTADESTLITAILLLIVKCNWSAMMTSIVRAFRKVGACNCYLKKWNEFTW